MPRLQAPECRHTRVVADARAAITPCPLRVASCREPDDIEASARVSLVAAIANLELVLRHACLCELVNCLVYFLHMLRRSGDISLEALSLWPVMSQAFSNTLRAMVAAMTRQVSSVGSKTRKAL